MAGKVKITFTEPGFYKAHITVVVDTGSGTINLTERVELVRAGAGQMTEGATIMDTALNYSAAFNLDYRNVGQTNNFGTLVGMDGSVTIIMQHPTWQFVSVVGTAFFTDEIDNTPPKPASTFAFKEYVSGNCNTLTGRFEATGGNSTYSIYANNVLKATGASPIDVELNRGVNYQVRAVSGSMDVGVVNMGVPRQLIANDFNLSVANYVSGASVTIESQVNSALRPLSYSLDGVEWKETNLFTGLAEGDYTLRVRDKFGCVTTKAFSVDGITELTEKVFTLSEINPIRYAHVNGGKKNMLNTLSCHENKRVAYPFFHKYLEDDVFTTQFKTNASNINVYSIDEVGNTQPQIAVQMTENVGLEAKSTATLFDLGGGRSGVYFGTVDKLDVVTDAVIETLDFGFTLPEWANEKGQLVNISGIGQVAIDRIGYSDFYESFILELAVSTTGTSEVTLYAQYNLQPYEVYEFQTYMGAEADRFNLVIEADDFLYVSEKIKRVADSDNLFEIRYSDSENRGDMVYATGIEHLIRLEGQTGYRGEQTTEGYNGDTQYHSTDDTVFNTEAFYFPMLTSAMLHKLRLIVAHSRLMINGILYKLAEEPELTPNLNSNLGTFLVVLKSGGNGFLDAGQEIISGSLQEGTIGGALEASKGRALLLWTKNL